MTFHLASRKIIKDWTDYNEHMNMAYYVLIFDEAWETMLNKFEMGGAKAQINKRSTMVVETRTTYDNEVGEGKEVEIILTYFDHDKKRLQYKLEMVHSEQKYLASTIEILSLYVDLGQRKVSEFEDDKIKLMEDFISKNKNNFNDENLMFSSKLKK